MLAGRYAGMIFVLHLTASGAAVSSNTTLYRRRQRPTLMPGARVEADDVSSETWYGTRVHPESRRPLFTGRNSRARRSASDGGSSRSPATAAGTRRHRCRIGRNL